MQMISRCSLSGNCATTMQQTTANNQTWLGKEARLFTVVKGMLAFCSCPCMCICIIHDMYVPVVVDIDIVSLLSKSFVQSGHLLLTFRVGVRVTEGKVGSHPAILSNGVLEGEPHTTLHSLKREERKCST